MLGILSVVNYYIIGILGDSDVIKKEFARRCKKDFKHQETKIYSDPRKKSSKGHPLTSTNFLLVRYFAVHFFQGGLFHDESAVRKCFLLGEFWTLKK